jgi:hypothetical protein
MKRFAISLTLGVGLVLSASAAGTNYNWKATAGGNWSVAANWTQAGYPQAGDDASFTGTVAQQTVTIATGNQAVNNLSVIGSSVWTWAQSVGSVLNLGGTFTYNGTATNSQFGTPILGGGALVVNSGRLMLCPTVPLTNDFNSVIVNGGILTAGRAGVYANTNHFGAAGTIVQVGAVSGTNDAMVEFGYMAVPYPQPILIRTGSTGRATLRFYGPSTGWYNYGARLGGGITLQKDVHLVGDTYAGEAWWRGASSGGNMDVKGPITGIGNVCADDVYNVVLSGTNSFMGQLIVNANHVWVSSPANTFTGTVNIARGSVYANNDGALGAPENIVILGGPGTLGTLGMSTNVNNAITPCVRPITLAGNGGFMSALNYARPFWTGPVGGTGRLIIAPSQEAHLPSVLYGANNYSGGTVVLDGAILGGTNTAFGTGNIEVRLGGFLGIYNAANIAPGATVTVKRNPLMDTCGRSGGDLGLYVDYVPSIATNSNGKLAINFTGSTNVNAWLANGSQPIGDGTMFLGTWNGATISATGLAALVVNDPTHTYKIGTSFSDVWLDSSNTTVGALADLGGQPYNVQVGRPNIGGSRSSSLATYDDQRFSGTLSVYPGHWARFRMSPGATANCLGATNGNVVLYGHRDETTYWRSLWIENSAAVTRTNRKNNLTYEGSAFVMVDAANDAATWTTTVEVVSLTRGGRSTLGLQGFRGFLGRLERFVVNGGVPAINGMVAPWMWNDRDAGFLDYGATGFTTNLWDGFTLAAATASSKISLGATEQIPAGGVALYALRMTNNCGIQANGTAVLTNTSGGVLLGGTRTTNEAPMDFGANEAVVITRDASSLHYFMGQVRGSGGLTKTGKGRLWLMGDNTTLTGGIVINQGDVIYTNWMNLGNSTITINGGSLLTTGTWAAATAPSITNNIVLGPCGGVIGNVDNGGYGRLWGSISGSGWVRFVPGWGYSLYGTSTYSGGTFIEGMCGLNLYTNDALGTGPLCMGFGGGGTTMNNYNGVMVWHDLALNTNTFVEMKTRTSRLFLRSANPQVGSVDGTGFITLGAANGASTSRATFGLDNRDAEYFGQIEQENIPATPCHIVKAGTGTWTLWGIVIVNGSVTVTNGTLRVNNWVNPLAPVTVYPGATLDGIGTVGVVSNLGGTVKGNLIMQQLSLGPNSVLQVALNGPGAGQYDVATVNGPLNLTGGALALTLGFKPTPGQTFTILNNAGGSISGQFALGQTVSGTYNGQAYGFKVTYNSGTSIVLTALSRGTVIGVY